MDSQVAEKRRVQAAAAEPNFQQRISEIFYTTTDREKNEGKAIA
jgi:hypothetical protein